MSWGMCFNNSWTVKKYDEKKREPKWLTWRVILKISSLFVGKGHFFFIIMFRKMKVLPLKRELFSKTESRFPKSLPRRGVFKKRLEMVLLLKKESHYGFPREVLWLSWRAISPDKKRLKMVLTWKREMFSKWLPFRQRSTIWLSWRASLEFGAISERRVIFSSDS